MRAARFIPNQKGPNIMADEELADFSEFIEPPLAFPWNGKKYVLPPLDIPAGLELAEIFTGEDKSWRRKKSVDLFKLVLGPLWDEMVNDGCPLDFANRAALTAIADHQYGREVARIVWETNADPKALPDLLRRRAVTKANSNRAQRRSNSTGGAKKTPSRGSTTGTTSRKS